MGITRVTKWVMIINLVTRVCIVCERGVGAL